MNWHIISVNISLLSLLLSLFCIIMYYKKLLLVNLYTNCKHKISDWHLQTNKFILWFCRIYYFNYCIYYFVLPSNPHQQFREGTLPPTGILNCRRKFRCTVIIDLHSINVVMTKTRWFTGHVFMITNKVKLNIINFNLATN